MVDNFDSRDHHDDNIDIDDFLIFFPKNKNKNNGSIVGRACGNDGGGVRLNWTFICFNSRYCRYIIDMSWKIYRVVALLSIKHSDDMHRR